MSTTYCAPWLHVEAAEIAPFARFGVLVSSTRLNSNVIIQHLHEASAKLSVESASENIRACYFRH